MNVYSNPYDWNKINLDLFFGRSSLLSNMCQRIARKTESFAVIGGRRMGKTTLLRKIEKTIEAQYGGPALRGYVIIPVYVDFQTFPALQNPGLVWAEIASRIVSKAKKLPNIELSSLQKAEETLKAGKVAHPFNIISSGLASFLGSTVPGSIVIVVLLDEVEKILLNEWCDDFWRNWRALIHNTPGVSGNMSLVLSGSVELCEIAKDRTSSLFGVLEPKLLEVFSLEDSLRLITEPGSIPIDESISKVVADWSGGHPFIIQYLMSHLYDSKHVNQRDALEDAKKSFIGGQEFILRTWWSQIGSCGQDVYRILASVTAPVQKARLISKWSADDVNWALDVICSSGIGKRNTRTSFVATGTLFREWAQESGLLEANKAVEVQAKQPEIVAFELAKYKAVGWSRQEHVEQKVKMTELELRSAISRVYQSEYGKRWEKQVRQCLTKLNNGRDILEIEERCSKAPDRYASPTWTPPPELIQYTSLGHLECLIISEWDKFNFIFGTGREARRCFTENFVDIAKMRNALSHPLPVEYAIPETELMRAEVACDDILTQLHRNIPS